MRRMVTSAAIALVAIEALVAAQGKDVNQVLAEARAALGGDKIAAVKTLASAGRTLRTGPNGNTTESEFELSMALPDKYLMRTVLAAMGTMSIYRNSGFNGNQAIDEIDRPPNLSAGNMVIRIAGPGGTAIDPDKATPEQKAELDKMRLASNKREFARLTLGMFASAFPVFPLEFTYAGEAESPDGKADVIGVKGEGEFAARLFVDQKTHLPLMLSWTDKEPMVMRMQTGGPGGPGGPGTSGTTFSVGGGGTQVIQKSGGGGTAGVDTKLQQMSPEDRDKMMKDMEEQRKAAEANRRTVEYRIYYTDYRAVGDLKLPFMIQRAIDGKTTEEMVFDSIKLNGKIDPKKFETAK